jgi:predicted aldo/keto reductase-like oxidoreductase
MNNQCFSEKSVLLTDMTPFVYGTTRLGDDKIPFDDRVEMARAAMDTGVWFHTSRWYGNALDVLRKAFDYDRLKIPKLIIKLGGDNISQFREDILKQINNLGISKIDVGQICIGGDLASEFANGGNCFKEFRKIKEEGLVDRFVMEVFPWTSDAPYSAIKSGYTEGIIDGYIFYLNPLQRFASNKLWDLLKDKSEPIIAMRTVAGGLIYSLSEIPGFAWKPYLQERAKEVLPIFERSGVESWTEFCVRFAHSFSQVRATVGATSNAENFQEFLTAAEDIEPLPYDIVDDIVKLHYRWSDETDIHAEPWTM